MGGKGKGPPRGLPGSTGKGGSSDRKREFSDWKRTQAEADAKALGISFPADTNTNELCELIKQAKNEARVAEEKRVKDFLTEEYARERLVKETPAAWRKTVPGATWGRVDPSTYPHDYSRQDNVDDSDDGWEGTSGIVGGEPVVPLAAIEALREFHAEGSDKLLEAMPEDLINLQPALRINNSISMAPALDLLHTDTCTWNDVIEATKNGAECLVPVDGCDDRRGATLPRERKRQAANTDNADKGDKGHSSTSKVLVCGDDPVAVDKLAQIVLKELCPWKCFKLGCGMEEVLGKYPVLCRGAQRPQDILPEAGDRLPAEIVPGFMYLGGAEEAMHRSTLKALQITCVLNASDNVEHYELKTNPDMRYYRVPVGDFPNWAERIADRLEGAVDWVEQQRKEGRRVLVHCKMGMSRSTTCVLGWMVKYGGWTLKDAFLHVKQRRKVANPNPGFLNELCRWELYIRKESSVATFGAEALPTVTDVDELLEPSEPISDNIVVNLSTDQFSKYDTNSDGVIDQEELLVLRTDIGTGNIHLKTALRPTTLRNSDDGQVAATLEVLSIHDCCYQSEAMQAFTTSMGHAEAFLQTKEHPRAQSLIHDEEAVGTEEQVEVLRLTQEIALHNEQAKQHQEAAANLAESLVKAQQAAELKRQRKKSAELQAVEEALRVQAAELKAFQEELALREEQQRQAAAEKEAAEETAAAKAAWEHPDNQWARARAAKEAWERRNERERPQSRWEEATILDAGVTRLCGFGARCHRGHPAKYSDQECSRIPHAAVGPLSTGEIDVSDALKPRSIDISGVLLRDDSLLASASK